MGHWWDGYPWRMIQTNLREIDMEDINAERYAQDLKDFGATVATLNAAGIIANYKTKLDYQPCNQYLHGDSLHEIIDACHKRGIRVIARTDFSKVRYEIYEKHPDWAYRTANGEIVNYNGYVHVCPNGDYQQKHMFEILREVLTTHPFDGVFCNMSGFQVVDYSGIYHGPCHCDQCKREFKKLYGLDLPQKDNLHDPVYSKYIEFKNICTRKHFQRLVSVVKGINKELAIEGLDYIRTESSTEIGRDQWQYSASSNARKTSGPLRARLADNASVDFMGFRYRHTSVSPALMSLRQWQNLANAGTTSLYIMGRLDNHRDVSSYAPTKRVFDFHKQHEAFFRELTSAAEVLLIHERLLALKEPETFGWIRALTESHIPFDEVSLAELNSTCLKEKRLVILGDIKILDDEKSTLLDEFAAQGGIVLASGHTGLYTTSFTPRKTTALKCLGIKSINELKSGLMSSVFEVTQADTKNFPRCISAPYIAPGTDLVIAEFEDETQKYLRLIPEHPFGPPESCYFVEVTDYPGMTVHPYGKGFGIYISWMIGSFYYGEGYQNTLNFIQDVLFNLCDLPELAPGLTPMVELVLCKKKHQTVIQLINGTGCFANSYYSPLPILDIHLVLPDEFGNNAKSLNGGQVLCQSQNGTIDLTLDKLWEYEAIVIQ